jgi:hypothetical protein
MLKNSQSGNYVLDKAAVTVVYSHYSRMNGGGSIVKKRYCRPFLLIAEFAHQRLQFPLDACVGWDLLHRLGKFVNFA